MSDEEKELSREESLAIIQQMINTAKKEQKDDGRGWIIWGWMLFLASVLTVLNNRFYTLDPFFFWNVLGLVTLAALVVEVVRNLFIPKTEKVKTYTKTLFQKLNTGFFICIMFNIFALNLGVGPVKGFALLIDLYAFWALIHGTALEFRPSVIAAYLVWVIGFIALFQTSFETVMLLHAAAVLCGYIIPGHIARYKFQHKGTEIKNQISGV